MQLVHCAIQLLEERLAMKKWSRKHGWFRPLLTPHGTYGYRYLPLTNCNVMFLTKSFAPLVFCHKFPSCSMQSFLWLSVLNMLCGTKTLSSILKNCKNAALLCSMTQEFFLKGEYFFSLARIDFFFAFQFLLNYCFPQTSACHKEK